MQKRNPYGQLGPNLVTVETVPTVGNMSKQMIAETKDWIENHCPSALGKHLNMAQLHTVQTHVCHETAEENLSDLKEIVAFLHYINFKINT